MGSFLGLSIVLFLIAFFVSKERIVPDAGQKTSVRRDLGDLMGNRAWVTLFLATVFYFTALLIRGNVMLPYFENLAGKRDLFSWFNGFGLVALLVGVTCSTALVKKMGKRTVFLWSMLLTGFLAASLFLLSPTGTQFLEVPLSRWTLHVPYGPIYYVEILRQFAFGCSGPVLWSMMADVADYGEWKTGRRATGTVIAAVVFALWVGVALGGAAAGWLLSLFGYVSDAKVQTAQAQLGIRLTPSVFAGISFLAVAVCLLLYPITRDLNRKIAAELVERRKGFSA
jgi:Na+/melibiose symporter-like transporter